MRLATKRLMIASMVLAAGVCIAPAAFAKGSCSPKVPCMEDLNKVVLTLNPTEIGPGFYRVVQRVLPGDSRVMPDGTIKIYATVEDIQAGRVEQWFARELWSSDKFLLSGYPTRYPTDPGSLRRMLTLGPKIDATTIPPASPSKYGMDRQPFLTNDWPEVPGSLTTHPTINLARRHAKELAPNQIEYLEQLQSKRPAVPGTLRVTLSLVPSPAMDGRWQIKWWVYNFEYDASLPLDLPPPQCPPGSPGTWPNCNETPPPTPPSPPADECPPTQIRDSATGRCRCPEGQYIDPADGTCRIMTSRPKDPRIRVYLNE